MCNLHIFIKGKKKKVPKQNVHFDKDPFRGMKRMLTTRQSSLTWPGGHGGPGLGMWGGPCLPPPVAFDPPGVSIDSFAVSVDPLSVSAHKNKRPTARTRVRTIIRYHGPIRLRRSSRRGESHWLREARGRTALLHTAICAFSPSVLKLLRETGGQGPERLWSHNTPWRIDGIYWSSK